MSLIKNVLKSFNDLKMRIAGLDVPKPPYSFVVQIGDPVLRQRAQEVKVEDINSEEMHNLIRTMCKVMRNSSTCALSAPQVGVPLRVFVTEVQNSYLQHISAERIRNEHISTWPLKVFINPRMTIENSTKIHAREGCLSLQFYDAEVPRATAVKIEGLDQKGQPHSWTVSHFAARVVQHEMDHLEGNLYVDTMNTRTFQHLLWKYLQTLPKARKAMGASS